MTGREQAEGSRIPEFSSREEEAEWFDIHDMADYQDEFKTVDARFSKNLAEPLIIGLDPASLAEVRAHAREKGTETSALVHEWILDRLRHERARASL